MFKNVTVQNQGVDWGHEGNIYWQHKVCQYGYGQPCLALCRLSERGWQGPPPPKYMLCTESHLGQALLCF